METYRLKNIAILILVLLNAFLLLLLGYQHYQSRTAAADAEEQLRQLLSVSQLTLSTDADLHQPPLSTLTITRNTAIEAAIASVLLGGEAEVTSQGGGIYSYATDRGSIQFRSGGSFEGSCPGLIVADPVTFASDFCSAFGYQDLTVQSDGRTDVIGAVQYISGVPIEGCGVSMTFENGALTAVAGSHISLENAAVEPAEALTSITALVRFLDYRGAEGIVCSRVDDVQCVYVLQSSSSTLRLLPAWQIVTDTSTYFVDCATGDISAK